MARKKAHAAHGNHERWLVSWADFMTLLFAWLAYTQYVTARALWTYYRGLRSQPGGTTTDTVEVAATVPLQD